MSENQREQFLRRISTVGSGLREDIQMILGTVVTDLRQLVIDGTISDTEVTAVVALHDKVEAFWRASLASQPPLKPEEIVVRLREFRDACTGPAEGFRLQLDQAVEKAQALYATKKYR